ncbi:hypothetical protein ABIB73_005804 [Bradyrhizobium sp. F1.4.3]
MREPGPIATRIHPLVWAPALRRVTACRTASGHETPRIKTAASLSGARRLVMRVACDQLLRRPSAARFHWATLSEIIRVDFIAAWLS